MSRQADAVAEVRPVGTRRSRPWGWFDRALLALAAAACFVTLASGFARAAWLFELCTHFPLQLAAGASLLLACALLRRRLLIVGLAAVVVTANGAVLLPYVLGATLATAVAGDGIRLMSANVHYRNRDYDALLGQVRATDPDVLGVLEVDAEWLQGLAALDAEFPWQVRYPSAGPWGLALYSKLPLRELPASPYREGGVTTAILVELEHGDVPVKLALAHVSSPTTPARAALRNVQLDRLAGLLAPDGATPRILVGDLNITPWSPYYADLAAHASLANAARGFGYVPTWPTGINPLKIPIDHCLVSDEVQVLSFHAGPAFGSDHLPIVVELAVGGDETGP